MLCVSVQRFLVIVDASYVVVLADAVARDFHQPQKLRTGHDKGFSRSLQSQDNCAVICMLFGDVWAF